MPAESLGSPELCSFNEGVNRLDYLESAPKNLADLLPVPLAKTRLVLFGLALYVAYRLFWISLSIPQSRTAWLVIEWLALGVVLYICNPKNLWPRYRERNRIGHVLWSWLGGGGVFYHTITRSNLRPEDLANFPYVCLALGGRKNSSSIQGMAHWHVRANVRKGRVSVVIEDMAGAARELSLDNVLLMMNYLVPSGTGLGSLFLLPTWEQIDTVLLDSLDNTFDQRVNAPSRMLMYEDED